VFDTTETLIRLAEDGTEPRIEWLVTLGGGRKNYLKNLEVACRDIFVETHPAISDAWHALVVDECIEWTDCDWNPYRRCTYLMLITAEQSSVAARLVRYLIEGYVDDEYGSEALKFSGYADISFKH
jgi:hypothetical protein